jgi:hypothetical protein
MREQSLHVVHLQGSADEGVEGPQQEWQGVPAAVEILYMYKASAKIFYVQYPALEVPAYSL